MISVALASYNGEKYILEQIQSILEQSVSVDEIVIVDDCSKDDTVSILKQIKNTSTIPIHIYKNETNLGYKKNFYKALSYCKGDYIFLCDQDDCWLPNKVELMMTVINEHSEIMTLSSSFDYMDGDGNILYCQPIPGMSNNNLYTKEVEKDALVEVTFDEYLTHNFFQGCSLLIKKEICQEVLNTPSFALPHDWLINLTASKRHGMYFLNIKTFFYRIHESNTIGVPLMNRTKFQRRMDSNTIEVRTGVAKDGLNVLQALIETDPDFYKANERDYESLKEFYLQHINYLKQRNWIGLIRQNKDPHYSQLKSRNARMMDIFFCFTHLFSKD